MMKIMVIITVEHECKWGTVGGVGISRRKERERKGY
jgi:hypothetical protein